MPFMHMYVKLLVSLRFSTRLPSSYHSSQSLRVPTTAKTEAGE